MGWIQDEFLCGFDHCVSAATRLLTHRVKHKQTRFLITTMQTVNSPTYTTCLSGARAGTAGNWACLFILNLCQHSENELKGEANQRQG